MNNHESLIRRTVAFIINKYLEPFKKEVIDPPKIRRKVSQPRESIITAVAAAEPFYIADEVLFFYLAINDELTDRAEDLLWKGEPLMFRFPLFPFDLVDALAPFDLSIQIQLWQNTESYISLFEGECYTLRTPRLDQKQLTAPIYCAVDDVHDIDEDEGFICYSSLTNLLLMVADCYETGAYYYNSSTQGSWQEDFSKSEAIFHKYHPGLRFRSPHEWEHFTDGY